MKIIKDELTPVFHISGSRYGHVSCPNCNSIFPIKQHQGKGAGYAKATMTKLKDEQFNLLTWWISGEYRTKNVTKSRLIDSFRRAGGRIGDPDSRISELLGLELIDKEQNGNDVTYSMKVDRVARVLSKGGKL